MNTKKSFAERLQIVIDDILIKKNAKSQAAIAREINYDKTSLSQVLKGLREMPLEAVNSFVSRFSVNKEWLATGTGKMYAIIADRGVPFYDVEVSAGQLPMLNQDKVEIPVGYLDLPEFKGCDFAVPARGDSMAEFIQHGDWVIFKRYDHTAYINFGQAYGIVTAQDFMVKYVKRGSDKTHIELQSHNPDERYSPFEIRLQDILFFYKVMGVIKRPNF